MSFHRSCCCKEDCFPHGTAVSFLDLYNDTLGDCGDCPIEGGCNGEMDLEVEILEAEVDCHCEVFYNGAWNPTDCPYIPCENWPGPGTYEFLHCGPSCIDDFPDECQENEGGFTNCTKDCPCAIPIRLICNEASTGCTDGTIRRKCCSRLHVHYGAYHDGEKYWLSDNPMFYFPQDEEALGINCKRQCGAVTMSTAPVCQGDTEYHCSELDPNRWCSPVGCCEDSFDSSCGNCPFCADPTDAPFCCESSPNDLCEFHGQDPSNQNYIEDWDEWCEYRHGSECLLNYEPYYWKFCGIGGWGASTGDVHIARMYTLDDDDESPTYGQQIPCAGQQGCGNTALYDIYDLTGGGGGVEPFVPHVLILYAEHIRVGTQTESRSSYTVRGWWVSCTSTENIWDLPIEDNDPDCHCPDSPTAPVGGCCFYDPEEGCVDLTEADCNEQGGNWQGIDDICSSNPC